MLLSAAVVSLAALIASSGPSSASKLNVPRVLLPYDHDGPINFTLKVFEGGCYQWSCSRDELVSLTEVGEDGCANEVQVSAISRSPTRQTAIILAQDSGEGQVLRCDVLIDAIQRLEIVTTTRELYVEEAPEEFEVRAYDDQGNEFSTLEGVEIAWDLQTLADRESVSAAQTVLRFMTFAESPYESPPAIAPLEESGRQGYMVLVEGRQTGTARLSVRLAHSAYQHVVTAWVDLMVVANLLLEPADVTLLPQTTVTYTVYQLKQGHLSTIDLSSSQFYLQVADPEVAELEGDGISVQAKILGNTQVILRDKNVDESSSWVKQPSASVRVVEPSYLLLKVVPPQGPALVTARPAALAATAYDAHHNRIYLAENVVMETLVPAEYFTPELVTKNGSYVYGVPIKEGNTVATAMLSAVEVGESVLEITPPLTASLELAIYPPLQVLPPLTVLPWDPLTAPTYTLNLTAVGGSGSVAWSSSRAEVVGVNKVGMCHTKTFGAATITASSTIDPHNKDSAQIFIVEAIGLSLLEGEVEAEVDTRLALHLASHTSSKDGHHLPFTACQQLPFNVELAESSFAALPDVLDPTVGGSCAAVEVVGKAPGFSTVKVFFHTTERELDVSTLVAAYRPLVPLDPSSGETVLAVGSSRVVVFQGGPLPWPGHKLSMHKATVKVDDKDLVEARLVGVSSGRAADIHGVEVVCQGVGETDLTLTVANSPSQALPHPRKASAGVRVVCAVPDSLTLVALIRRPPSATIPCPTHHTPSTIAHCHKPLHMEVVVKDSENRRFDNMSSLSVTWSISDPTLATAPAQDPPSLAQVASLHGLTVPVRTYQVLQPVGEVGEVTVTAALTVTSGRAQEDSLTASLPVRLVRDAVMEPASAVLYRHQDNKLDIKVRGGSGHFELHTPQSDVAALTHRPQESSVNVCPLSDGEVTVVLVDVCLEADTPASSHITVASIATLDLILVDRVEVGGTLEAEVVALTDQGAAVPAHTLMALTPHPQSSIITVTYRGVSKSGNAVYDVLGRHVGDTMLRVSAAGAGSGAKRVHSPARPLQVFPPLTLHPRNITLIVGAVYQVETQGGPYPDAVIEYSLADSEIATASHTGLVTATVLGTTTLTAVALTHPRDATRRVVYSKDSVTVNVIPLEKIRIYAPLRQLEAGTSMPLYALGRDSHQGPPAYASTLPPLAMEWSLNDKHAAHLVGVYSENGLIESSQNQGVVRLRALRPGRVTVTLKVQPTLPAALATHHQLLGNTPLTDKLEIRIFESLKLRNPEGSSQLLLTPHSEAKIFTNRDGDGQLSYRVESSCGGGDEAAPVVEVGPDGVVRAGARLGQAVVVVTVEEGHGATQGLSVLVEVKKVRYLQLGVGAVMGVAGTGTGVSQVPPGTVLPVTVTRHDDRGRTFHASNTHPAFRTSRFDLVGVSVGSDNRSLEVEVRGLGQTVLHVWDLNSATAHTHERPAPPSASAYLRIDSAPAIAPDKVSVPQGTHLCFSSLVVGPKGEAGRWGAGAGGKGAGEDVLTVDPTSGVGVSHRPGRATVTYQVSPAVTTTTDVTVLPITQITMSSPPQPLSNGVEGDWQVAAVVLGAEGSDPGPHCLPADPPPSLLPFTCHLSLINPIPDLDMKELFEATPVYTPMEGYGCRVRSLTRPQPQLAMLSPGLEVEAAVEGAGVSAKTWVAFLPAPVLDLNHITLTLNQPTVDQLVRGSPEVLAALQVPVGGGVSGVEVSLGAATGENTRTVTVVGREAAWSSQDPPPSPIILALISPLTRSLLQINVTVEEGGEGCAPRTDPTLLSVLAAFVSHYDQVIISLSCLTLTIACIVIGYHALLGPGYKQTRQTGVFANSSAPPPPLSPFSSGSASPGSTPSPPATSPSPQRPTLWSVNTEPVYGAAQFRRGAYQGSPTYTPPHS